MSRQKKSILNFVLNLILKMLKKLKKINKKAKLKKIKKSKKIMKMGKMNLSLNKNRRNQTGNISTKCKKITK